MAKGIVTTATMLTLLVCFTALNFAQTRELQITTTPRVQHVTWHSATIQWSTNIPASSFVRYGTDINHLSQAAESAGDGQIHTIQLENLRSGTVYYYQVISSSGMTGTSVITYADRFATHGDFVLYDTEPYKPPSR